jgi:acetolactate synthase-1/2/3 large subunit
LTRTGAQILVDQLRIHGVDTIFGVPGESYLALLDALHDAPDLRFVVCRHEGGAAVMAEAHGKLTGRPGVCAVTRGPGATNASIGVHTARQDSTPMLLLVGDIERGHRGRGAFQEVDFPAMFAPLAKWAAAIEEAARVPELVSRAFHVAVSGRPGPVVLALPEDMLMEEADMPDAAPYRRAQAAPAQADLERLSELLRAAARPFAVVGGGGWSPEACTAFVAFAEAWRLPVGAAFRRQDLFDNGSASYAGDVGLGINPKLAQRIREADLLLAVGERLGDIVTGGYTLLEAPRPAQRLVHVLPDPDELGLVYGADLPIVAGVERFAVAAGALAAAPGAWEEWTAAARADYEAWQEPEATAGELDLARVVRWLAGRLPDDAIVTNGAGNYSAWAHRFYRFRRPGTQLAAGSGAMGYGVPAAVGAKVLRPDRIVVCFSGDGDFLMNGQELATAVQYELPLVVLVVNNGMYGTIRMHQEREFPGRVVATDLVNPDFAAYARSFGAHGAVVERTDDFAEAFEKALAAGVPALLELRVDPEQITPRATIAALREAARSGG